MCYCICMRSISQKNAQASLLYGEFENFIPFLLHLTGISELNVSKHLSVCVSSWPGTTGSRALYGDLQWFRWRGNSLQNNGSKCTCLSLLRWNIVISAWIKKDKMQRCTWCFLPVCNLPPSQLSERDIKLCPMTPYGVGDFGQQWFRQWLVAWRHQAVTWTNVDLQLGRFCGITTLGQWVNYFIALLFFQGHPSNLFFKCHTWQKSPVLTRIGRFLTNSNLNWLMVTKWCTKLEIAENRCPILFHLNWAFPDWNCSFNLLMGLK